LGETKNEKIFKRGGAQGEKVGSTFDLGMTEKGELRSGETRKEDAMKEEGSPAWRGNRVVKRGIKGGLL